MTATLIVGVVLALACWGFGQWFGSVSTATATDVGIGRLLVQLAITVRGTAPQAEPTATPGRR